MQQSPSPETPDHAMPTTPSPSYSNVTRLLPTYNEGLGPRIANPFTAYVQA